KCSVLRTSLLIFFISVSAKPIYSQWSQQVSGSIYDLYAIHFINNSTGFIGSNSWDIPNLIGGEIIRTTNGGSSWNRVLLDSNFRIKDFYFFNSTTGLAVGGSYSLTGFIYRTTDAGLNWINITSPDINSHIYNIQYVDPNTAFAGANHGVFKSTNAGLNWERSDIPNHVLNWGKVHFFDSNTGIYTGDTAKVHRTSDAGDSWFPVSINPKGIIRDVYPINENSCLIIGDSLICRTNNRGLSWLNILPPERKVFLSVQFINSNTGYMSGLSKTWKSTNSGMIWFAINSNPNPNNYFISTFFSDVNTGYVGGQNGLLYKTTTGGVIGIEPISNVIPGNYALYQNYPNPFNPNTKIKFAIPKASFVKLAVYDMLGREVDNLVNEQLSPGTYEVSWNALKFSSGIYLYKISTNDFSMVKKMSVIK
ncbi:MAG: T9SS type A sorting domain-containing protein, partial [Ignavibacteria bacterium]|nr:T9SS type A sorting domain-containing protein [Ignavibacteria bacterium]